MSINLKPHNQEAYEKVKDALTEGNRTAVIHPTGTGKSYIAIKLAEENPERRFLYLAPSNSILYQLKDNIISINGKMLPNIKRMTYTKFSNLSQEEKKALNVDYVILDEFHHCGSPVWGKAVEDFIEENTDIKTLGLSATPIRYFDGNVDMAERLFGDNIASEISFEEAVVRGILPEYDYISALYGYEKDMKMLKERIDSAEGVAASKREEAIRLFSELQTQLGENVENLPEILNKHMQNKDGKYVIFCRNLEDMQEKIEEAQKMFSKVNPDMAIYSVSSLNSDNENERILRSFSKDNREEKLKLMFSVNMLNEGFHLPDVDGVVMMRPTKSPTVYKQQLGRALSVSNKDEKRPVIIDLVDNFDSIEIIEDLAERLRAYEGNSKYENSTPKGISKRVRAYDYVRDINETVKKIEKLTRRKSLSIDEKIDLFEKYINENENGIIQDTVYEGYPIGTMLVQMRRDIRKKINIQRYSPEQIEKLTEMGLLEDKHESTIDEKVARLEAFCINNSELWLVSKSADADIEKFYLADIDEQERKNIIEQLNFARKDYEYIYHRKIDGKLPEEYAERLRQAGVGRSFGYKDEIEDLAKQYEKKLRSNNNYSEDKIKDEAAYIKWYLYSKDMKFGGLDKYRQAFVEALINRDREQMEEIMPRIYDEKDFFITQFDVSSPDFINQTGLGDLVSLTFGEDISNFKYYGLHEMGIFNGKDIKDKVLSTLTEREAEVLDLRYGLTDGKRTRLEDVGRKFNCTRERIRVIEEKALRKLRHPSRRERIKNTAIDSDREEQFIRKYFEHHDIFSFANSDGLDDNVKSELLEIYNNGIREREIKEEEEAKNRYASEVKAYSYSTKIEDILGKLDLSVRSFNCLKRAGINTVGDLLALSEEETRNIRNLGPRGFNEVQEKIADIKKEMEDEKAEDNIQQTAVDNADMLQTDSNESIEKENDNYMKEVEENQTDTDTEFSKIEEQEEAEIENPDELKEEEKLEITEEKKETTEDLSSLSLEELEKLISSNNATIENNERLIKQALIDKIMKQQERIAEQEKEISELKRKRNAHEQ